jgi:cytochrome c-type biogenesis protein CcmH/NrfG
MESTTEQSKLWSDTQAYVLAVVCLVLGIVAGYLLHAPKQVAADVPPASPGMSGMQGRMPTPDQMKHMGDKMAEPILAELQKDPNNADLLAKAGSVYFRAQQFPASAEYYERAAKAKPAAETFVSLSNALHYAGSDDRALEALNRALQLDPESPNALFNLGMLKWQAKNDPNGAVEAWQRLLKANPDHPRRAQVEEMIARAKQHMNLPPGAKTNKPAM